MIALIAGKTRARGAKMLFVSLSNGIQVTPDRARTERYMRHRGIEDIFYPDRRLVAVTENLGIPTLTLAAPLRMWAQANATCVHGFDQENTCSGHWNAHGHRLAGEAIAEKLCRRMLG